MEKPGLVVVVTEEAAACRVLTHTLEAEGWVVVPLDDGGELFDFLEFISAHPGSRGAPQLIVADASVPGPRAVDVVAWARSRGLDVPLVLFNHPERTDASAAA